MNLQWQWLYNDQVIELTAKADNFLIHIVLIMAFAVITTVLTFEAGRYIFYKGGKK